MIRRLLRRARGWLRPARPWEFSVDAAPADREIEARVRGLTLTGPLRVFALLDAVGYVVQRGVPGALVECGVWRGGSVLAMVLKLQQLGAEPRDIYLYDTFEGMTEPTKADTSAFEAPALATWRRARRQGRRAWGQFFDSDQISEDAVRAMLLRTGYPAERLHFVRGPVERTLPGVAPARVALLRLDTDWYESTRHELTHLYPRLSPAGVLIVDDYGHWQGCRKAVDEYFSAPGNAPLLLHRIDYAARIAVRA